ncbi:hypothetical protein COU20_01050 [Candidatus Kaiserbacteria bacterium CG10_big_fil_rev_8_21_14_0_10_59_10]|uniref:THIF-type NAD/FAD binding fold domain-containing protein n=1 Tax=Candidatus Kaiserbacteria bacterium CG10_big_fil_rev_8_21_14_0_10_59_10 TaxID=1974612 RepID=A0A2H0U8E0_9BACT|nr:MAG: hypothetical protein COU20_01050 [Candidatus Kaiserbacteria bacterium CG10_big_fil_rev_8_21_14_0_10_59_10]
MFTTTAYETLFDAKTWKEPLHIIGVGGIGSHAARIAGKERFPVIHLHDGDVVEEKNMYNQWFDDDSDIGLSKAEVVAKKVSQWTVAHAHPTYVEGHRKLSGVVCLCTGNTDPLPTIVESCVWDNPDVSLLLDARMDAEYVFLQVLDPRIEAHRKRWYRNWYPHSETENRTAGCGGGATAVGITASLAADLMVAQVIRYAAIRQGYKDTLDNHIEFFLRPLRIVTKQW